MEPTGLDLSRKQFLHAFALGVAGSLAVGASAQSAAPARPTPLTLEDLKTAAKVAGIEFTEAEIKAVLNDVNQQRAGLNALRPRAYDFDLAPACHFSVPAEVTETRIDVRTTPVDVNALKVTDEELPWMTIRELSALLRAGRVTSTRLTELAIARCRRYDPKLKCVAALLEKRARAEAAEADRELAAGRWRGPLHGIPYGLKDLFDTAGDPCGWGATPYKDRVATRDCAVYERLRAAGAVLVAKLSLGALAQNDVWYGGKTQSPWDPRIGSSGSSAGSGSAVAAGLVPFAIGTETNGSIVSPAHNCRVTGLRTTFGSVSRYGAMPLCWSLDKVGPLCRDAEDAALVTAALLGRDERDHATVNRGLRYRPLTDLRGLKLGYATVGEWRGAEPAYVQRLRDLGANLNPFVMEPTDPGLYAILFAEAGAVFDELTRSEAINTLKENDWADTFRTGRFVSAIDLLQADRVRHQVVRQVQDQLSAYDAVLFDDRAYPVIYNLNLAGLPQVLVPFGADSQGRAVSFSLIGPAYSEGRLLQVAAVVQRATGHSRLRPDMARWA